MTNVRIWTKTFTIVTIVNFFIMLSMFQLVVTMANFTMEEYHASSSLAGLVATIFIIGILIGRIICGMIIENLGNKKMLIAGIVFFNVIVCFYFWQSSVSQLIAIRFFHGIGVGVASSAAVTIATKIIPPSRKGEGISYFSLSVILAGAFGPLIGMTMLNIWDYDSLFIFSLIIGMISLLLSLVVDFHEVEKSRPGSKGKFHLFSVLDRSALPISIIMFIMAFAYSAVFAFIDVYTLEIDLRWIGSLYFLDYSVSVIITRPITGRLLDMKNTDFVVYPVMIAFVVGMFLLSQANTGFLLLSAAVVLGYGYGNFQSIAQTIAVRNVPHHRLARANTTYFISMDFGTGIGPYFLGFVIPSLGYNGLFFSMSILAVIGVICYRLLIGNKHNLAAENNDAIVQKERDIMD